MSQIATHNGTVIEVQEGLIKVEMHVVSACSACKAHEKCAFVDKADKVVEVESEHWQQYAVGDAVIVSVNESMGLLAVLLAYLLPAVVVIGSVTVLSYTTDNEAITAFATLALIVIYFLVLYKAKERLQRKFSFGIQKRDGQ
jgi:sigma-E factor negative regulatory protein RseC